MTDNTDALPPLPEEIEHAVCAISPHLLALAKRWAANTVHSYQFANEAERLVRGAVRAALAAQQGAQVPQATDELERALIAECERAMLQRDEFLRTGVSTAAHGGSHDTLFGHILRKFSASPQAPAQPELRMMQCPGCGMEFADGALHDANLELHRLKKAAQAEQEPVAWMHPDGRVVPHSTIVKAHMDGGAMLSSLSGYTIPLVRGITKEQPKA